MAWDPAQYEKFKREREAPFADALGLVARREGLRVIDLGCGTGELTRRLADALPSSEVVGLDSSAEMLARAQAHARPGLRFVERAIEQLDGEWDLIFSHAALHWVEDHARLIPRLMAHLRPGGQLVVQMPSNHHHPSHGEIRAAASEPRFRAALAEWKRQAPVQAIDFYAEALHAAGGRDLTVFEKVYPHVLPDSDAIVEWQRGTALLPYLERLPAELHEDFLAAVRERLRLRFPSKPVFFGFRRILFAAFRA